MVNRKDDKTTSYIIGIIGLILIVMYLGKAGFLGAVVTTCENTEPTTIQGYSDKLAALNGTMNQTTPVTIEQANSTVQLTTYTTNSALLGMMDIIDVGNRSCSDVLAIIAQQQVSYLYIILGEKQVLLAGDKYLWCNYANTKALRSSSITTITKYDTTFVVCTSQEVVNVTDAYVSNEDECFTFDGEWVNSTCKCADGTRLKIGQVCAVSREETTVTTPAVTSGTTDTSYADTNGWTSRQKLIAGGIVMIVLFMAYWFFEKGPDKGFIRRKRRR
jgi:hypothetical protein